MSDGFNQPSSGGGFFESKNHIGHLVLITKVHDVYHNPSNVYQGKLQPRDEAKVDVVDLDGDQVLRERVIMTHPGLVNKLVAGSTNVLGRIGQVPTKDGQNVFFNLDRYEDADVPRAQAWVNAYQAGQFQQGSGAPAGASSAPQAAPVPQNTQPPAPAPQVAQSVPQAQPQAIQLPEGVDPAALQALMAQLGGQPVPQQQGQQPPY